MKRRNFMDLSVGAIVAALVPSSLLKAASSPHWGITSVTLLTTFNPEQVFTSGGPIEIYENIDLDPAIEASLRWWKDDKRTTEGFMCLEGKHKEWITSNTSFPKNVANNTDRKIFYACEDVALFHVGHYVSDADNESIPVTLNVVTEEDRYDLVIDIAPDHEDAIHGDIRILMKDMKVVEVGETKHGS